jgi:hypothetical protein
MEYLALPGGPGGFTQSSSCSVLLGCPLALLQLSCTGLSPSLTHLSRVLPLAVTTPLRGSHNPSPACRAGLGSPQFARRYYGDLFDFSSSGYLDVSVPRVPPLRPMCSGEGDQALPWPGFPIRISPAQSLLTAPRSFSQLVTSFIGSMPQGIRRTLFVACSSNAC